MKKTEQRLPKFKATTLRPDDLKRVTGGLLKTGTAGTRSVCHVDGTDDADPKGTIFFLE